MCVRALAPEAYVSGGYRHLHPTNADIGICIPQKARERLAETGVRIADDLTARDLETKKRVIPLMNKLYTENQKPRFANGRLYSNGKLVPQETIDTFLSQFPGN